MGAFEKDGGCGLRLGRLYPSLCTEAPLVTWLEAGKAVLRPGGGEVIAFSTTEKKEFSGHESTDDVKASVFRAALAAAVTEESCFGLK